MRRSADARIGPRAFLRSAGRTWGSTWGKGQNAKIRFFGAIAWLGACAVLVADLVGMMVVDAHNPISDTISKLAVGRHAWIQDLGLILLALLGLDLVIIAEYNQYAGELGQGAKVHRILVFVMFGLFAGSTLLLAEGFGSAGKRWKIASTAAFGAWVVLAPLLFVMPTSIDGAYERLVSSILVGWVAGASVLLLGYAPVDDRTKWRVRATPRKLAPSRRTIWL